MKRTILLADDSPTIQRLVTQTFADADFDIVSVSNGEAAIKKFEDLRPSMVLADIYMPGKNGYEVCEYVKNHPSLGGTPVVLLVGAFDAFDQEHAKEAGAAANITKPFEPHALVELVESLLPPVTPEPEPGIPVVESEGAAVSVETGVRSGENADLLGLEAIFKAETSGTQLTAAISEEDIERIVDRVIQRLSKQMIENIAWDIVRHYRENRSENKNES